MRDSRPEPHDEHVHGLVERWATISPDAPAVAADGTQLTYRELNARANQLARVLRRRGVGVESLVGVAIPRSPAAIVACLGVWKAGAGYVPLDPEYPVERREFMLADSAVSAIVSVSASAGELTGAGVPVILLDDPDDPLTGESGDDLGLPVSAGACAQVLYTSGSTGTPKGVVVEHRSVAALILDDKRVAVQPGETVVHFAPTAFDASTFEIWSALGRGARVAVLPGGPFAIADLGRHLRSWHPDWLFLTAGLFHLLVDYDAESLASVGCLITGGDVLAPHHMAVAAGQTHLYAVYGPTEATAFSSLHDGTAALAAPGGGDLATRTPIGSPLVQTTFSVRDANLDPVAAGEIGEIYIGGLGLARGYHRRPALTAERFLPDPSSPVPGARMYRTGDLGRLLPDGQFEFHGRIDRQVKVRGFRIELGEVETTLAACPGVAGAAVIAVPGADREKRLACFVAPTAGADVTGADLRAWASRKLPAHVVPAAFVVLEQLPLDANGKVDRKALPDPWASRDGLQGLPPFAEARTGLERLIAGTWAEALGLDRVGVHDDFYALGGDSIRSVGVLEQLRSLGMSFTAYDFFRHPTVAELAELAGAPSPNGGRA
jgi:amino acid adenylation domain-containing protein